MLRWSKTSKSSTEVVWFPIAYGGGDSKKDPFKFVASSPQFKLT